MTGDGGQEGRDRLKCFFFSFSLEQSRKIKAVEISPKHSKAATGRPTNRAESEKLVFDERLRVICYPRVSVCLRVCAEITNADFVRKIGQK